MTPRQLQSAALAHHIQNLGGWVSSVMPLAADANLRFQILDKDRDAILEKLASWDWASVLVSSYPRICNGGWEAGSIYEISIPQERQPIVVERKLHGGEIAEKDKIERERLLRYLGWQK
jgi:hypothetical protein